MSVTSSYAGIVGLIKVCVNRSLGGTQTGGLRRPSNLQPIVYSPSITLIVPTPALMRSVMAFSAEP